MDAGYLGGMLRRDAASCAESTGWSCSSGDNLLSLDSHESCARLFTWDSLTLLVRGHVRFSGDMKPLDLEAVAQELRSQYLETNELAVDDLEGSFTLALLDAQSGRVILYRNLVGTGCTYYYAGRDGFRFGSNLAALVEAAGVTPRENLLALPTYFLYRLVPGAETLFDSFFRVLPGEEVTWDGRTVGRRQRSTFAKLLTNPIVGDPVEAVEETMRRILADCAALRPEAVNLLSGGVDSSYLQALWNRNRRDRPRTFSITVDHPRTRLEMKYALSAARVLGTDHTLISADEPYADYLLDLLGTTGEPPNYVQSAYFGHLARALTVRGCTSALCGEGADALFGLGLGNQLHNASVARVVLPLGILRRAVGALSGLLGFDRAAATCRLADRIGDQTDLSHPINRVAAFTDWPAVEACFGRSGVRDAAAGRRALLDRLDVSSDPLYRMHAAAFLGEATDMASLWTTLFNAAGADLLCPFLDSRLLRLTLNLPRKELYPFRRPKELLKRTLSRHVGADMAWRTKQGFGQPIFEWLSPGGQLRPLAEQLGRHEFVDSAALARSLREPNWFLYNLLCYDLWHRLFIERQSLSRDSLGERGASAPLTGRG